MSLQPTFTGYVATTQDALILFQAAISGVLAPASRRPHDRERADLVRSGSVFIFNEQASGIKRWTDGIAWSPSRILGNFLVYRQLEKPFAPGEKKRTAKRGRKKRSMSSSDPYSTNGRGSPASNDEDLNDGRYFGPSNPIHVDINAGEGPTSNADAATQRSLVGSLVDSYGFKENGLIKKTMSINVNGFPHHLVSYYRPDDVLQNEFTSPSNTPGLKDITISEELTQRQNFRVPLESNNSGPASILPAHQPQSHYSLLNGGAQQAHYHDVSYEIDIPGYDHHNTAAASAAAAAAAANGQYPAGNYNGSNTGGSSSGGNYVSGYRLFGSGYNANLPAPHNQNHDYYHTALPPPSQSPYPYNNQARSTATTTSNSPSLPPLSQTQGYSYQYGHEYHPASDPRRLPDSNPVTNNVNVNQRNMNVQPNYSYGLGGYAGGSKW